MNTLLGKKIETKQGFVLQQVGNLDRYIGKTIKINKDFLVTVEDKTSEKGYSPLNLKDKDIVVEDVIRDCGLYLFCKTSDNQYFALAPHDLEDFEEVN